MYTPPSVTPPYPRDLCPELTRVCNLTCIMCPVHSPTSPKHLVTDYPARMEYDQAIYLLNQTKGWPSIMIGPQIYGEPLLHPRLFDIIQVARGYGHEVDVNTNGMLLDEHAAIKFLKCEVRTFCVSIDGASKRVVEKIRLGCDFDRVLTNTKRMIELRKKMGRNHTHILISMCNHALIKPDVPPAVDFWLGQGVDAVLVNNNLREGEREWNFRPHDRWPCPYLWKELGIYTNGDCVSCRADIARTMVAGNAFKDSVLDIWHGKLLEHWRTLHKAGKWDEIPECSKCIDWARFTPPAVSYQDGKVYETSAFTTTIYTKTVASSVISTIKNLGRPVYHRLRG